MVKQRIEYDSPLDALIAITKQLGEYENRYRMKWRNTNEIIYLPCKKRGKSVRFFMY